MVVNRNAVQHLPRTTAGVRFSPRLQDAFASGLPPLTVITAPRGYGKTSLISAWLGTDLPVDVRHYLALDPGCRTREQLWSALGQAMFGDPALDLEGLRDAIGDEQRASLIIIDNYQYAGLDDGVSEVDELLIDLVQSISHIFVIVAGRVLRPLETLGSMALPTVIIGPAELALTPERLQLLANDLGTNVTRNRALSLTEGVAGWPALLRMCLNHSALTGEDPELNLTTTMNYIDTVLGDADARLREFVMRACVADELTPEIARNLAAEGAGPQQIREAYGLGLLRRVPDTSTYEFPSAIKRALFEMTRAESPASVQEARRLLASIETGNTDPFHTLQHAVEMGDWEAALGTLQENFIPLANRDPRRTAELLGQLPPNAVRESPYAKVLLQEAAGVPTEEESYTSWPGQHTPGQMDEIIDQLTSAGPGGPDEETALLLWGLGAAASGQMDSAIYVINRCWARTRQSQDHLLHAHVAASAIAAVYAYQGEIHQARLWLADGRALREEVPPPGFAALTYAIADALTSVDAGAPSAGDLLEELPEPKHRGIIWALRSQALARHAALYASDEQMTSLINELRAAVRYMGRGSVSESILINALIELLINADMLPIARELTTRTPPTDSSTISHARLALAQNDFAGAINLASQVGDPLTQLPRLIAERDVIRASAAHGLGEFTDADRYFTQAVRSIRASGQFRALTILPYYLFVALAGGDTGILQMWPVPGQAESPVAELTPREVQILRSLAHLSGPSEVAHTLNLSVNTVKTHVQAIYRKLKVSNRSGAIARIS